MNLRFQPFIFWGVIYMVGIPQHFPSTVAALNVVLGQICPFGVTDTRKEIPFPSKVASQKRISSFLYGCFQK